MENEGLNGRLRLRRNLLEFEDLEGINVIRVKDKWLAVVNKVMNL